VAADIEIRAFRDADRAPLIALWRDCKLLRPWNNPNEDIDLFKRSPQARLFLAFRGDRLVGALCLGWDGHRAWPYYLAVAPDCQRQGIARRLMQEAEGHARVVGAPKMNVIVRGENDSVAGFYEALSYEREDRILLGKRLSPPDEESPQASPSSGEMTVTVTYLHMLTRPVKPHPPKPANFALSLLHANRPSVPFYRFLYDTVGGPWLWYERRLMTDRELAEILEDSLVEVFVLYVEGAPAGYFELDRRETGVVDMAYFGLMPDYIGCRLGPFLLGSAIDTAWSYDPEKVTVNTCTLDHPKALSLYQRFGFRPYDQAEKIIPDPRWQGVF
jgi:ribosomal protein S18 acetylase RimI-like enzyme